MADNSLGNKTGNPVVLPNLQTLAYSPTIIGFGTPTAVALQARALVTCVGITGKFACGTSTTTQARLPMPTGLTVGTWGGVSGTNVPVGRWVRNDASNPSIKSGTILATTGDAFLTFGYDNYSSAVNPTTSLNGDSVASSPLVIFINGELVVPCAEYQASGGYSAYGAGLATSAKAGLVSYEDSNSFTGTLTGFTTGTTGTCRYDRVGKQVTLYLGAMSGTSNATTMTLTGLPAGITPTRNQVMNCLVTDNGSTSLGRLTVASTGVITFDRYSAINNITSFTASGGKAMPEQTITYSVA